MRYLLDTSVLIYLGTGRTDKIGRNALDIYKDPKTSIFISQISYWELAIKINIKKLFIPVGLHYIMQKTKEAGIEMIPVKNASILVYQSLPVTHHKDPFDRYIISVALTEKLKIISNDSKFDSYKGIIRIWK